MILLDAITKEYNDDGAVTHALRGISFEIKKGEFVAIMGASGSGKSTLLHILSFLDRPSRGDYFLDGKNINTLTDEELAATRNHTMGFVFQAFNLLGRSSVYENVELPLLYARVPSEQRKIMVEHAVLSVGLSEKMYAEAGKLSGGQKQRVAIARALVNNPSVIFADEPTGNLDSESGAHVMEILERLNNEEGHTVLLVTHETYTAEFANRILTLKDGQLESDIQVKVRRRSKEDFFK